MKKENITLIGMMGAGKSYVGNSLALTLGWDFIDTDLVLEQENKSSIQDILDKLGEEKFIKLESEKIKEYSKTVHTVFAPGGSVVYGDSIPLLKSISYVIFLSTELQIIKDRIDVHSRGIVGLKNKTLEELYNEREKLYKSFADFTVDASLKTPDEINEEILAFVRL